MGADCAGRRRMTKPKRYKRYSAEFKREALRRAAEEGMTDTELGTRHEPICSSTSRCSTIEDVATGILAT